MSGLAILLVTICLGEPPNATAGICVAFTRQAGQESQSRPNPQSTGAKAASQPTIRGLNNSLGFREHRPGQWSYINPEIRNPGEEEAHLEVVAFFAVSQNRKFARRIRVPPRSVIRTSLPIRIPPLSRIPTKPGSNQPEQLLTVQVHLYDISDRVPRLLVDNGKRSFDTEISLRNMAFGESGSKYRATAVLRGGTEGVIPELEYADDLVNATRINFNQVGRTGISTTRFLPESIHALDSIDQLVVDNDQLLHDTAGLQTVQRWLARGGELWIMLDLVSSETVERILGDELPFQLVDRTSLNQVSIRDADPISQAAEPEPRTFEQPVPFARVLLTDGQATHTVNGWPAAFRVKTGSGRILFTTIGARAWMHEWGPRDERHIDPRLGITEYKIEDPMETLGYQMYAEDKRGSRFDPEALKSTLVEQVGYAVLNRSVVMAILGGNAVLLLLAGVWLLRLQKLEWLFFLGPSLAVLSSLLFLALGWTRLQSARPSVARFQFVESISAGSELRADGMTIFYSGEKRDFELGATRGGTLDWMEHKSDAQEESKILWDEFGAWKLAGGVIEPGLTVSQTTANIPGNGELSATGRFEERGFAGTVGPDLLQFEPTDLVLALPGGNYHSVQLQENRFVINESNRLARGKFTRSLLLDDIQRWHQSVYLNQFPPDHWQSWVTRPTLYAWTRPLDGDLVFPEDFQRLGGALVQMPVRILKTPPGSSVHIPSTWISLRNQINMHEAISPSFDARSRKWLGSLARESTTRIRFQLPRQVLPFELDTVQLKIESIICQDRIVELKTVSPSGRQVFADLEDYRGGIDRTLTANDGIHVDDDGGIAIDFDIKVKPEFYQRQQEIEKLRKENRTDPPDRLELSRDQFEGISLSVTGRTVTEDSN